MFVTVCVRACVHACVRMPSTENSYFSLHSVFVERRPSYLPSFLVSILLQCIFSSDLEVVA